MTKPKIAFFGEGTVSDEIRMDLTGRILKQRGYPIVTKIKKLQDGTISIEEQFDIAIFSRPHSPGMIEDLKREGVKTVVDQDDDFWSIPKDHVAYGYIGPGNQNSLRSLERCIAEADVVTTSSEVLQEKLFRLSGTPTELIVNGYDGANLMWSLPRNKWCKNYVNIGWCGTITHRTDFLECLPGLLRVIKEFTNTRIVIGGDPEIYHLLDDVPENRKLFITQMPYTVYPYTLTYMDILLAPLKSNEFNNAKSDIKCVDAGVRHMPWIGSRLAAYESWREGGILIDGKGMWFDAIAALVVNTDLRKQMGLEGWQKAQTREQNCIADRWEIILQKLMGQ